MSDSDGLQAPWHVRGRFIARTLLRAVAEGTSVDTRDMVKLASTVLSAPEVQLAELVLEGGPHRLRLAIDLAEKLVRRSEIPEGRRTRR